MTFVIFLSKSRDWALSAQSVFLVFFSLASQMASEIVGLGNVQNTQTLLKEKHLAHSHLLESTKMHQHPLVICSLCCYILQVVCGTTMAPYPLPESSRPMGILNLSVISLLFSGGTGISGFCLGSLGMVWSQLYVLSWLHSVNIFTWRLWHQAGMEQFYTNPLNCLLKLRNVVQAILIITFFQMYRVPFDLTTPQQPSPWT